MEKLLNNITINTKYGAMAAATVTPVVIFGSIYIACAYTSRARKKRAEASKVRGVLTRSVSIGVLHGGKMALERLVDYHHARADATLLEDALDNLNKLIQEERPPFKELQRVVAKLEMSRKEDDAVEKLESAWNARKEKKPHEAYEYQMLLIEMYIYKGDFEKALKCECLNEEKISDARRPLYKAIVHGMLEDHKESRKCFGEFNEIRAGFEWPPDLQDHKLYEVIEDFEKFQKVVQLLKMDIQETRKN
ncbi:hypothetical protein Q3G72_005593 [Acer saccharum]|nr:hypothetical protein Q3G72_005593 [Acer saccharum]